jgi:microcystin-dependent protein
MAYLPFPSGTLLTFAGSTAPDGWLLCDGSAVSRTTYARLFAAISTTYGNGDGALTFNIPDLRGVYPRGAGTNGTANYGGVTGHTPTAGVLATKGGQKTAKNGLSNAASSLSALTLNSSGVSGSATSGGVDHTHTAGIFRNTADFTNGTTGLIRQGGASTPTSFGTAEATAGASAFNHTHGLSGTAAAQGLSSSTVTAQTITGDTETTPAFLAVNYIIKL